MRRLPTEPHALTGPAPSLGPVGYDRGAMNTLMSSRRRPPITLAASLAVLFAVAGCSSAPVEEAAEDAFPDIAEILIAGERVFPESITSTADGTIIVGSMGIGSVLKAAPGEMIAEEWIPARTDGLITVLGVLADEASGTLWVCSTDLDGTAAEPTALKAFDLVSTAPKGTYPLSGERPICNDIAIASDGAAYVADTGGASVVMLPAGGDALTLVSDDELLTGADGLAFGADPNVLYVTGVSTGRLVRVDLGEDGKATAVTELALSREIERPDGMRSIGPDRLLLAEGAGRMSVVTVEGDVAHVETLLERGVNTPAVTATRGRAWVVEGKLDMRSDPDSMPGAFKLFGVPLPE